MICPTSIPGQDGVESCWLHGETPGTLAERLISPLDQPAISIGTSIESNGVRQGLA